MAIKIRCTCGTPLTVADDDIGKRLNCSDCGKPFRISPEKVAACAMKKKAVASRPNARAASAQPQKKVPTPVEAAQPANLDQDILTLIHDDLPAGALKLRDDDEPSAAHASDASLGSDAPPSVVLVDEAVELTYAGAGQKGRGAGIRSESDAIQAAKHSFWVDLTLAFVYPFQSIGNILTFIGLSVLALIELFIWEAPMGGILMGPMMLMGWFAFYGWFCAFYMSVVVDTAAGAATLPGIRIDGGWWEDVLKPGLLFILAQLIVIVPPALLLWCTQSIWAALFGLAITLFLYPFVILLFSLSDASNVLRIDLIALTLLRTLPAYVLIFLLLTFATAVDYVVPAARVLNARGITHLPDEHFLIAQNFGFLVLRHLFALYTTAVCMRLIGLYYLHFKHKFAFEFE